MNRDSWKYGAGFLLGLIVVIAIRSANSHPPCYEQQPTCGYVQTVNPVTGELEQHYVCK